MLQNHPKMPQPPPQFLKKAGGGLPGIPKILGDPKIPRNCPKIPGHSRCCTSCRPPRLTSCALSAGRGSDPNSSRDPSPNSGTPQIPGKSPKSQRSPTDPVEHPKSFKTPPKSFKNHPQISPQSPPESPPNYLRSRSPQTPRSPKTSPSPPKSAQNPHKPPQNQKNKPRE